MLEMKEDDDNMIVIVVADEDQFKDYQEIQIPSFIKNVKQNDKKILKEDIKEEFGEETEDYDVEYLEDGPIEFQMVEDDDDYNDEDDDDDISDHEIKKSSKKNVQKKKTIPKKTIQQETAPQGPTPQRPTPTGRPPKSLEHKVVSYVNILRKEHPEMAEDEQLLIEHLANIMRDTIPPEPPADYYKKVMKKGVKYECSFCGELSENLPSAGRHYQFKHGEFYLKCFACGKAFRNTVNLYKHEKCCRAADSKVVLRARGHYLGRRGRGRPFTTANKFVTYTHAHPDKKEKKTVRKFFCTKCPASFVRREFLAAHENLHEGVKPYRCHQCPMAYMSYPSLKRHLLSHGEDQYICDHCGRKFKLKTILIVHLQTHRPLRKHGCMYCDRRFAQKVALRHHVNTVHLNLPAAHGCPLCPKRYARLTHVKDHIDRAHGLTMITRKMCFEALPTMTESEVNQVKKLFKFEVNQSNEPKDADEDAERNFPPLPTDEIEDLEINENYDIIENKETIIYEDMETENIEGDNDNVYENVQTNTEQEIYEEEAMPEKELEKPKPKKKRRLPQRKKVEDPEPPMKIYEEIDDDLCNVVSKRKKKTVTFAPQKKQNNDEMNKIVRSIKSTLTNRKKAVNVQAETKKSCQNFYEIKRDFMNQLINEIEIPASNEEQPEYLELGDQSEDIVPGTEIPVDHVPWTKKTEYVVAQKQATSDDDSTDEEEWKVYKDSSEKNIVITDFLQYVKTGVVPKHVSILRREQQTTVKSKTKTTSGKK